MSKDTIKVKISLGKEMDFGASESINSKQAI